MNQVKDLSISRLNNGDFYQFIENIVAIVAAEPLAAAVLQPLAADQPVLLNSFKKEKLTEETKQIVENDLKRDRAYLKFKYLIEAYAFDDQTPANSVASAKLLTFIIQHGAGKLVSFDYNKETASLTSLVADCNTHASAELSTLNLNSTLNYLQTCNVAFKTYYSSRGDAASVLATVPPFYKLRKEVINHYKTFASDLEALQRFIPASATVISDLITRINVEVDKFRLMLPAASSAEPALPSL